MTGSLSQEEEWDSEGERESEKAPPPNLLN